MSLALLADIHKPAHFMKAQTTHVQADTAQYCLYNFLTSQKSDH